MGKRQDKYGLKTLVTVAVVSAFVGLMVATGLDITQTTSAGEIFWHEPKADKKAPKIKMQPSFVELAKELSPSVVNISTTMVVKGGGMPPLGGNPCGGGGGGHGGRRSPFEDFFGDDFDKFFGNPEREFKRQSLGSGFLISKEGYIISNNHVVENATEIIVTLSNSGKKEYEAEVIGKDANLDLALLKIDPDGAELHPVVLGDSDALEIGEWVVAIGNPFGLGGTVTAGIVSQKGRTIGAGPYDNFIQTDASINPGNSGGPLFNMNGEVVGVNTAIIAGGQGIGFTIPINQAKEVLVMLKEKGKVTRGWIGVSIQEVTPEIAKSFGLGEAKGALISSVMEGDPAEKGGIEAGDIIVEFDGKDIEDVNDLPRIVAGTTPCKKAKVKVVRNGKNKTLFVTLGEKKDPSSGDDRGGENGEDQKKLGLTVQEITPEIAERLGMEDADGVLVSSVDRNGPAQDAGLMRGDVIKEINRTIVKNMDDFSRAVKKAKKDDIILMLVARGDRVFYTTIKLKEKK